MMDKREIESFVEQVSNKNQLVSIGDKFLLSKSQIEVFNKYQIPYENIGSLEELIYIIEEIIDEVGEAPDLENVSLELNEMYYYHYMRK